MKSACLPIIIAITATACCQPSPRKDDPALSSATGGLKLLKESPIQDLLAGDDRRDRLEASGVTKRGADLFVAFDNMSQIARLNADLSANAAGSVWRGGQEEKVGYEAIVWVEARSRFFTVIEAVEAVEAGDDADKKKKKKDKRFKAQIRAFDQDMGLQSEGAVGFEFESENKGLEGLAVLGDGELVLGLCEGQGCRKKAKEGGRGVVLVLEPEEGGGWKPARELELPKLASFGDYADIAVAPDGRVAVVSQEDASIWIGALTPDAQGFQGEGKVWPLPRDADGQVCYCNVEGVAWIDDRRLVLVSDKAKDDQPAACRPKQESIHLFEVDDAP